MTNSAKPQQVPMARWLLHFGRPVIWPLAVSALCRIAQLLVGIGLMAYAAATVVNAAIGSSTPGPWAVLGIIIGLATVKGVLHYVEQYSGHWVAFKALAMLRMFFFERLAALGPAGTATRRSGDLLTRATRDIDQVEVFFAHTVVPAVAAVVVPVIAVGTLAGTGNGALAAVIAVFAVLIGWVIPLFARGAGAAAAARASVARGAVSAHLADTVSGLREIVAYEAQGSRAAEAELLEDDLADRMRAQSRYPSLRAGVDAIAVGAMLLTVVGVGAALGESVTAVAVVVAVAVALLPALNAVGACADALPETRAALARVRAIDDAAPAAPDATGDPAAADLPAGPPAVRFDGVTFRYPGTDPALVAAAVDDIELEVAVAERVAIVGPSGSGKSTLGALACRVWDADSGTVFLGGVDVRRIPLERLRAAVTVVDQAPFFFRGTLADNLRLVAPGASDTDLLEALGVVDLADLPGGLDTVLGERGTRLSGGQLQRLAIARGLLRGGDLLIFDEVTSQLDEATEALVLERLDARLQGVTVLWITHRAATVDWCDRQVRVRDGSISGEPNAG